ncbi:hypothetical protein P7K49_000045, partial [Saguinus oedipus]
LSLLLIHHLLLTSPVSQVSIARAAWSQPSQEWDAVASLPDLVQIYAFPSWCTGSRLNLGRPPVPQDAFQPPFNRHGACSKPHFRTPGDTLNSHRSHSNALKPWRACVSRSAGKTGTKEVPEGGQDSASKDSSELGP